MKKTLLVLLAFCAMMTSCTSDAVTTTNSSNTSVTDSGVQTNEESTQTEIQEESTVADVQTTPETEAPWQVPDVEFVSDLSEYEQYFDPENKDEYIILVNHENALDETFAPDDLMKLVDTREGRSKRKMRTYAAKALEGFLIEARASGCKNVTVTSAYRSYDDQADTFEKCVQDVMEDDPTLTRAEAEVIVHMDTAYPGQSEHQTGLACDMHNMPRADVAFADTFEAKWLAENAWKFGFILRYPEDKTEITKIVYEPWHFRYVGRYHAAKMVSLNMCLEEYTEYLNNN